MTVTIMTGDCRDRLKELPDESVQCVVTSPPYYGLRSYGTPPVDWPAVSYSPMPGLPPIEVEPWTGDLGLEPTPEMYIGHMVLIFRAVWRVLREDGVVWLNIGDSYATDPKGPGGAATSTLSNGKEIYAVTGHTQRRWRDAEGLKRKDLIGIPWRLAFALQADGWWLRHDVIWHKPNPMPESVTDRPTKAHEYVFLLSKAERYFYDHEAIKEPMADSSIERMNQPTLDQQTGGEKDYRNGTNPNRSARQTLENLAASGSKTRNKRSVWTIATRPFSEAHFAVMPPDLVEPCIKAGSREGDTVLDPFGGAGTVGLVADRLKRDAILVELNEDYAEMARRRIVGDAPLLTDMRMVGE